jgi:ubiquinone biosynthesis protein
LIDLVERARNGKLQVEWHSTEIERLRREIRQTNRRSVLTIIASAFIISAALVFALDGFTPTMLGSAPVLTWLLGGLGVLMLLAASSDM